MLKLTTTDIAFLTTDSATSDCIKALRETITTGDMYDCLATDLESLTESHASANKYHDEFHNCREYKEMYRAMLYWMCDLAISGYFSDNAKWLELKAESELAQARIDKAWAGDLDETK